MNTFNWRKVNASIVKRILNYALDNPISDKVESLKPCDERDQLEFITLINEEKVDQEHKYSYGEERKALENE